ncbi:MAG: DUF3810 domain-containing protein [Leadbetterella sp.]
MKKYLIILVFQVLFFELIKRSSWVDNYYFPYVFKPIGNILALFFSCGKYSIGLFLLYVFIAAGIFFLFKSGIKRIVNKTTFFRVLKVLVFVYPLYMLFWGLLYYREPIEERLNLDARELVVEDIESLLKTSIDSCNKQRAALTQSQITASIDTVFEWSNHDFKDTKTLFPEVNFNNATPKRAIGSTILSYIGTSGIYNFVTGEANVNEHNFSFELPVVCLHELAHKSGFASEDEANFVSYMACLEHPNALFRYSANYEILFRSYSRMYALDSAVAIRYKSKISAVVLKDREQEKKRWKKYENPINTYVVAPFYDLFLKSNGQEEGRNSYDKVLELIVAYNRKKKN